MDKNILKIFNYLFYIDYYEDIKKNNINNFNKAYNHLKTNGIKENRFFTFEHSKIYYENSWILYKKNNNDLTDIYNEKEAFQHYMNYGINENRNLVPLNVKNINQFNWNLFDFNFYIEINNLNIEINENSKQKAIHHYKTIGYKLNLYHSNYHSNLFYNIDWDRYISENDDLIINDFKKAFLHYINNGIHENRNIYYKNDMSSKLKIFNWKFYLDFNPDLINNNICTKDNAIHHFKNHGFKENRLYSNYQFLLFVNYDWLKYSNIYNLNLNEKKAFIHYLNHGRSKNYNIFNKINETNLCIDFFKSFNELDFLNDYEECKNYYLNLEKKLPYSYQHFILYLLFDWELIFKKNQQYLEYFNIENHKELYINYIDDFTKYKIKLFINDDDKINCIFKLNNLDELFINTDLIMVIINYNLVNFSNIVILKLIDFQNKLNEILNFNFYFIEIIPGFEFINEIIIDNNEINIDNNEIIIDNNEIIIDNNEINIDNNNEINNKLNNDDKLFCFVISSYNNQSNIYYNLLSVIYQNYKNWVIYYTNDSSTDNTHDLFFEIITKYNIENKVFYYHNDTNMKQSFGKNKTYKKLNDTDIVVLLDGDDWLSKNNVLDLLVEEYNKNKYLIIYSNYCVYDDNIITKHVNGHEYPIEVKKNKSFRNYKNWLFTHLKTGYAWLFKKIPDSYFKINDKWLDRCTDLAEMYSVAEIAGENIKHINDTLYVYNKQNSLKYKNSYYNDFDSYDRKNVENHVKTLKPLEFVIPNIYILNLKNKTDLKQKMIKQFETLNFNNNYEFFEEFNGFKNQNIMDKYEEYLLKYKNNKINKKTLQITKKHIHSVGILGNIYSTIELFKKINKNKKLDHVIVLEDNVYFHKDFHLYYQLLDTDLINKDFIFLGFDATGKSFTNLIDEKNIKLINLKNIVNNNDTIYGNYSYICSKKYRDFIIKLGIDFFIENNITLDTVINIFINSNDEKYVDNDLNFYLINNHIFIPEIRLNNYLNDYVSLYYKERYIQINNYLINVL